MKCTEKKIEGLLNFTFEINLNDFYVNPDESFWNWVLRLSCQRDLFLVISGENLYWRLHEYKTIKSLWKQKSCVISLKMVPLKCGDGDEDIQPNVSISLKHFIYEKWKTRVQNSWIPNRKGGLGTSTREVDGERQKIKKNINKSLHSSSLCTWHGCL